MIPLCRHCRRRCWRFNREHPPAGFCSVTCAENARPRKAPASEEPKMNASDLLALIKQHRLAVHNTRDLQRWWHGCPNCDRLEAHYAELLAEEVTVS